MRTKISAHVPTSLWYHLKNVIPLIDIKPVIAAFIDELKKGHPKMSLHVIYWALELIPYFDAESPVINGYFSNTVRPTE